MDTAKNFSHEPQEPQSARQLFDTMVGSLFKIWRRQQRPRLTQEAIASVLGISRQALIDIEKGERRLTLRESVILRRVYGVSMEGLLSGGQASGPTLTDIMQQLTPEEQQQIYQIMYDIATLLARRPLPPQEPSATPSPEDPEADPA